MKDILSNKITTHNNSQPDSVYGRGVQPQVYLEKLEPSITDHYRIKIRIKEISIPKTYLGYSKKELTEYNKRDTTKSQVYRSNYPMKSTDTIIAAGMTRKPISNKIPAIKIEQEDTIDVIKMKREKMRNEYLLKLESTLQKYEEMEGNPKEMFKALNTLCSNKSIKQVKFWKSSKGNVKDQVTSHFKIMKEMEKKFNPDPSIPKK